MKSKRLLCFVALIGLFVTQPVVANDGLSIDIVGTAKKVGRHYEVSFGDVCTLTMRVDRNYQIMAAKMKGWPTVVGYTLNPEDGNSALSVGFSEPKGVRSDAEIAKSPGFTKIVRKDILVGVEKVTFRQWADARHLYSEAVASIPVEGSSPRRMTPVILSLVANSEQRRTALENCLASIVIQEPIAAPRPSP